MEPANFSALKVMILGGKNHTTQLLRSVLGIAGVTKTVHVQETHRAIEMLALEHFSAVFYEQGVEDVDGTAFAVAARRKETMLNPLIPLFMLQGRARRSDVETARDAGATDVLTTPISPKTIMSKLQVAMQAPRPFIVAPDFFGPDRRAKRPAYHGSERRIRAAKKAKIDFTHV